MAEPGYLRDPGAASFGIVKDVAFGDYAWLYLTVHDLRYVVLHQWPGAVPERPEGVGRLKAGLAGAKLFEDGTTAVYDRALLEPPSGRPCCARGDGGGAGTAGGCSSSRGSGASPSITPRRRRS